MTTTEGHDMPDKPEPLTGFELDNIEARWSRYRADPDYDRMESSAEDVPVLLAEVDRLRAELKAAKSTDPRVTASALLRHIAFWGDESRTREELLELADMIDRFEDGYCPLCQHICDPSCALYPINAEAREIEAHRSR